MKSNNTLNFYFGPHRDFKVSAHSSTQVNTLKPNSQIKWMIFMYKEFANVT